MFKIVREDTLNHVSLETQGRLPLWRYLERLAVGLVYGKCLEDRPRLG